MKQSNWFKLVMWLATSNQRAHLLCFHYATLFGAITVVLKKQDSLQRPKSVSGRAATSRGLCYFRPMIDCYFSAGMMLRHLVSIYYRPSIFRTNVITPHLDALYWLVTHIFNYKQGSSSLPSLSILWEHHIWSPLDLRPRFDKFIVIDFNWLLIK